MISFIFSYFEEILQDACGNVNNTSLCSNPLWQHPVYVKDHIFQPNQMPQSEKGVCFEELLILGRSTTHTIYFGSEEMASSFKEFVYRQLGIGTPVHLPSISTQRTKTNLTEKLSFRSGERLLRITMALRPGPSRLITNLPEVTQLLLSLTGRPTDGRMNMKSLIDKDWLLSHMYPFDDLTFKEQVTVMSETDVFISVHGAALINGAFMKKGSVAIDILNGRFIEYVFSPPLREAGVELLYVSSEDSNRFSNCPDDTPAHCFQHLHAYDASEIECWKIRQCSVEVDLQDLYRIVMQAFRHVRSAKYS
eukprot:CAMPEP_0170056770 /NCGR_PEP_ID=MMETSP0019_2-20121128/49_1 /TAXON_ID=98059 /ORGANISM="Dinobryon sp., Strain UTEXLB2267" /LENGTH=306 /DNA_ID=CAMNT_0010261355 /DNA_START=1578 /DNA_END=2498 /DNA_ORIENTATION=+